MVVWKKINKSHFKKFDLKFNIKDFDDFISYVIISMILGRRVGYIIFYNLEYYLSNPLDIIKVWEGGMSFHGALIGIIFGTYFFSLKKIFQLFLLDIVACVSPLVFF